MNEFKNRESKLDPRLKQMLKAYGVTPERDSKSARRNQERFVEILNVIFDDGTTLKPAGWFSTFNYLKEIFAGSAGKRSVRFVSVILILLVAFLFGGMCVTAYAASASLPGDTMYPVKTTVENARANLASDPAARARLYMEFAGRRLLEARAVIDAGRYTDIAQATTGFNRDLQKAIRAIEDLSQTDPARASALSEEVAAILRGYSDVLNQMLVGIPEDIQQEIQSAIDAASSTASLLDVNDDEDDPASYSTSTPTQTMTATPNVVTLTPTASGSTPTPSSENNTGGGNNNGGNQTGSGGDDDSGDDDNGKDDDGGDD